MYKVLYIGFLTFQLISVFCNLKSSKKDILEAHNSRKFNIIGIVCQIIAVIFIMIILKMQGWRVKKYIVHFIIWGLGIISYYILDKTTAGDEFQNISLLLIGCLMFYAVYYISMISEIKKIDCKLNESGIFGGRGMGILINMFSLQYIFELYKKPLVCIVLIVVSVIVLILSRKYIKSFWTKNIWSRQFLLIFIAFNVLASSIGSVLGVKSKFVCKFIFQLY